MSLVSDEEYSRVHSHIEFLVDPDRLTLHCEHLKCGKEHFPSGGDLLVTFLKESSVVEASRSLRSQNFRKLAVRVFHAMQFELEDVEALLNVKYQRKMLNALLESDNGVHMWLLNYRWQLRTIQHSQPYASLSSSRPMTISDRDFGEARKYLTQWLEDPHAPQKTPKLNFQVAFEIADQLFAAEAYSEAAKYCNLAKRVADTNPTLMEDVKRAKEVSAQNALKTNQFMKTTQETQLTRSDLALATAYDRLEAFLEVLGDAKSEMPVTRLDALVMALEQDKANFESISNDILEILERHMTDEALHYEIRLQLEHVASLEPKRPLIKSSNLMWRLLNRKEDEPNETWTLGVRFHFETLRDLLRLWVAVESPVSHRDRFYRLCVLLCSESHDDRTWPLVEPLSLNSRERSELQHLRVLSSSGNFVVDPLAFVERVDPNDAFEVLTSNVEVEAVRASARVLAAERGDELVYSILMQRARACEAQEDVQGAVAKYDVLQTLENVSSDARLLWSRLLATHASPSTPFDAEALLASSAQLLEREIWPTEEEVERTALLFVNRAARFPFSRFSSLVASLTSRNPSTASLHESSHRIARLLEHFWSLCEAGERLFPGAASAELGDAFSASALHLDAILQSLLSGDAALVLRLLTQLKSGNMLTTIASFLLLALHFVYTSSKLPCDALRGDRLSKPMASVSAEQSHAWLSSVKSAAYSFEPQIFSLTVHALQRVLATCAGTSTQHAGAAYTLGDLNMHKAQYATAMRYFLLAAGNFHFSYEISDFLQLLPALILCLTEAKLYHFAIILHQYAQNIDYQAAIHLCMTWGQFFPNSMFSFLCDISIMEALVYTLKKHGAMDRATLIANLIAKPDRMAIQATNSSNNATSASNAGTGANTRALDLSRHKLFEILVDQLLEGGNWNGFE